METYNQLRLLDKKNGIINWMWDNKVGVWCGWGTESLPTQNLSDYLGGYFVVKFTGNCQGRLPQVKFIDMEGTDTNLVNFDSFLSGNPVTGAVVKIPLEKFGMDPKYSADPRQIKTIQFDAEYHSRQGELKIEYIGFTKQCHQ